MNKILIIGGIIIISYIGYIYYHESKKLSGIYIDDNFYDDL